MANLDGFDHDGQEAMDEFVFDWTSKFFLLVPDLLINFFQ